MSKWELGELDHLSRSADHLGSLANVLKDLGGDETILHELAQNADDAEGATRIQFSVDADALTVWNDGVFSNCGDQEQKLCRWRNEHGRSCDLHAFRLFSGRHKSGDASTTGAFGVGFTCVYHLTDHPELVTAGTHLLLDESASEDQRIKVCRLGNCSRAHEAPGTTFVLPWARSQSLLRQQLEVETVDDNRIARLEEAFRRDAAATLLFLKRVSTIDLSSGPGTLTVQREVADDIVRVIKGSDVQEWLVLAGEYDTSVELKDRYRDIDPDRSAVVQVAIPVDAPISGRFYAGLPSQMPTGWGGHINGSFYPRTDRKSFEFADGTYRSEWNLDLLDSAAHLVAQNLERVAEAIGVSPTWEILRDLQRVARDVSDGRLPQGFEQLFAKVSVAAAHAAILRVVDGSVQSPSGAVLPVDVSHYSAARVVHDLGLPVVDADLRSIIFETEYTRYGITQLTASRLIEYLNDCDELAETWASEDFVLEDGDVDLLLELLESLLGRTKSWIADEKTCQLALIPCNASRYAPAQDAVRLDSDADRELFTRVDPDLLVVDSDRLTRLSPTLLGLVGALDLETGLESVSNSASSILTENAELLIEWLESHRQTLESSAAAQSKVRALPIFPRSTSGRDSLEHLSIPSDFEDMFGFADLIDGDFAQHHWPLLEAAGAQLLSAVEYLTKHLLPRLGELASDPQYLEFVLDLAYNARRELDEAPRAIEALRAAPLVMCTDGAARCGSEVHMPNPIVLMIDPETPIADLDAISSYLHDTVVWLGASTAPSRSLINEAAQRLAQDPDNPNTAVCAAILEAITAVSREFASVPMDLANVRDMPWLPFEGGGKGKPSDVYPTFQSYLFESQGPRLGLPGPAQTKNADALYWLGMPTAPTSAMVVAHLRYCADEAAAMHNEVYVWLGRELDGPALKALADVPVIQVSPGNFIHPRQAFWQPTRLGRWASQLPHEMRRYQEFLDGVGVAEEPTTGDLDFILQLVAAEVGTSPLDPDDELVVRECWSMLDALLTGGRATARTLQLIGRRPSFPDRRGVLARPERLIFRDPRRMVDQISLLVNEVIDRERLTQRALECAGVTRAEDVIEVEPAEVESTRDTELLALLMARQIPLMRVIDGAAATRPEIEIDSARIKDLDIHSASTLTVIYHASIGSQHFVTPPQVIDAMLFANEFRVVHTRNATMIPVAREISRAIAPYLDPLELAPLIVTVLEASSVDDAMLRLDEYGAPSIIDVDRETVASSLAVDVVEQGTASDHVGGEEVDVETVASSAAVDVLGQGTASDHVGDEDADIDIDVGTGSERGQLQDDDPAVTTSDDEDARVIDENATGSQGTRESLPHRDRSGRGSSGGKQGRSESGAATRMRSYVLFGADAAQGTTGDESPDAVDIDRAGVARVLAYERAHGREPEVQDHTNPGFDVLSHGQDGELVRRIEIKSIRSEWTLRGVMLSARQFREAKEHGDQFWLYIVENAEDDELHRIHRIQDPANRIDFFGFDKGWEAMREPDIELDAQGAPAVRSTRGLLGLSPGGRQPTPDDD